MMKVILIGCSGIATFIAAHKEILSINEIRGPDEIEHQKIPQEKTLNLALDEMIDYREEYMTLDTTQHFLKEEYDARQFLQQPRYINRTKANINQHSASGSV